MTNAARRTATVLFAVALLASACNSSSPTANNPPPGGNITPVQSASVTATASNTFTPSLVDLIAGGTVTFSNSGGGLHNVNSGSFRCADGCDGEGGNGNVSTGNWTFTRTFPTAGTVGYVCDEHGGVGMSGRIVVH